jgi:4,5-dihydroxyphthalate decarboxylase
MSEKLTVTLGDYPHTKALKDRTLKTGLDLEFPEVKPTNRAFRPMVMEQKFDICELAIITFLMAKAYNKPLVLLPAAMAAHFPLGNLFYNPERGPLTLADLNGKRIGTRSFAQTTPTWLRGIIENEYGINWRRWQWITFEGAHVAEFKDPAIVERALAGKDQTKMLVEGELDAAIYGLDRPEDPRLKHVVPDFQDKAAAYKQKHGFTPINHVVVATADVVKNKPAAVREVFSLITEAAQRAGSTLPLGFEALTPSLEQAIFYAHQQALIPERYSVASLFEDARRLLGA